MRVGDLGTRCSSDQKHNIIKHSNFLLLFRHAVTSFSSAIQCNTVLRCGSLELTPCSNGVPPSMDETVVKKVEYHYLLYRCDAGKAFNAGDASDP